MTLFKKEDLDKLLGGAPLKLTTEEKSLPFDFKKYPGAMLIKVAPSLWAKVDSVNLTKKEQRARFESLLVWFCNKNGYTLEKNIHQKYSHQGKTFEGRIAYKISSDLFSCLVELIFDSDLAVASKMKSSLTNGGYPVLLKVGKPSKEFEQSCTGISLLIL